MPKGVYIRKPFSEEHKKKISEENKGKTLSEITRQKISKALKGKSRGMLGKKHTEKAKREISENNARYWLGKKLSEETRKKLSEAKKGEKHPNFGKKGYWLGKKGEKHPSFGKKYTEKTRKAMSKQAKKRVGEKSPNWGKIFTEEHRKNLSKSATGRILSEKTKQKLRIASFEYAKKIADIICPRVGHNEKNILDKLESELNYKIIRQYECKGYFIDGYIPELKVAIEVDERPKNMEKDIEREKIIKDELNCEFLRIKDYD